MLHFLKLEIIKCQENDSWIIDFYIHMHNSYTQFKRDLNF